MHNWKGDMGQNCFHEFFGMRRGFHRSIHFQQEGGTVVSGKVIFCSVSYVVDLILSRAGVMTTGEKKR
jgi:hypothetical protein